MSLRARLIPIAIVILFALFTYFNSEKFTNPETGKTTRVALSEDQESRLGLQSYQQVLAESQVQNSGPEYDRVVRIARRLAKLELRTQVRAHLLNRPRLFSILQALRGRKVTPEQIHQLRAATGEPSMSFRRIGREYLIMNAHLYQAFQRLRGRSLSLDQIAQMI